MVAGRPKYRIPVKSNHERQASCDVLSNGRSSNFNRALSPTLSRGSVDDLTDSALEFNHGMHRLELAAAQKERARVQQQVQGDTQASVKER